jgi:hypothetical protein
MRDRVRSFQILLGLVGALVLDLSPTEYKTIFYSLWFRNPQPGGPDSCINFPPEQTSPVIRPSTGFTLKGYEISLITFRHGLIENTSPPNSCSTEEWRLLGCYTVWLL